LRVWRSVCRLTHHPRPPAATSAASRSAACCLRSRSRWWDHFIFVDHMGPVGGHGSSRYYPATIAGVASAMTNRIGVGSSTDSAPPRASMARTSGGGHLGLGRAAWLARSSRPLGCLVSFASPASPSFANDSRRNLGRDTAQRRLATRASVHPIIPLCLGTHVTRSRAPCPAAPFPSGTVRRMSLGVVFSYPTVHRLTVTQH
jgi:hypothetical protein